MYYFASMYDKDEISKAIKAKASTLGFDACGIVKADFLHDESTHLEKWIEAGYNADLAYMERNKDLRLDPRILVEGTISIVVVLMNYYTKQQQPLNAPIVSRYAYGADYHIIIKEKLSKLMQYIEVLIPDATGRFFTDSAPILEHTWAKRAGLGQIGKNSLLLTPKGSFFFIGEILINKELAYDTYKYFDPCGKCTRCIDACPTQAIVDDRIIDARRCLSYLTIEKKGDFNEETDLHNRLFGCDICQEVCPWNRRAKEHNEEAFRPSEKLLNMTLKDWKDMGADEFGQLFRGSPMKRAKHKGIQRNLNQIIKKNEITNQG